MKKYLLPEIKFEFFNVRDILTSSPADHDDFLPDPDWEF